MSIFGEQLDLFGSPWMISFDDMSNARFRFDTPRHDMIPPPPFFHGSSSSHTMEPATHATTGRLVDATLTEASSSGDRDDTAPHRIEGTEIEDQQ